MKYLFNIAAILVVCVIAADPLGPEWMQVTKLDRYPDFTDKFEMYSGYLNLTMNDTDPTISK